MLLNNFISEKHTNQVKNCFLKPMSNEISYHPPCFLYPNLVILGQEVRNLECREAFDIHLKGMITK
jgi:hypothetical protein